MTIAEAIGAEIRACREDIGISMHDLARRAGTDIRHIEALETAITEPRLSSLRKLAPHLHERAHNIVRRAEVRLENEKEDRR